MIKKVFTPIAIIAYLFFGIVVFQLSLFSMVIFGLMTLFYFYFGYISGILEMSDPVIFVKKNKDGKL